MTDMADDLARLVDLLTEVAEAIDVCRTAGMSVAVPADLVAACRRVIARADEALPDGLPVGAVGELAALVPMRPLVLAVIAADETVTVTQVVTRCEALGVTTDPTAVSNALGWHVSRNALERRHRGTYRRHSDATAPPPADPTTTPTAN